MVVREVRQQGLGAGGRADTLPNVLSLGADPYDYDVNYLALSLRYSFAPDAAEARSNRPAPPAVSARWPRLQLPRTRAA